MNLVKAIVVDMDGTLCNSAHREHLARAGEWDAFHSLLGDDQPWPDVLELLNLVGGSYEVIGLTGRNEKYRIPTMQWLLRHNVKLDHLLMRPDNDWRSDHVLKPEMLHAFVLTSPLGHEFDVDVAFILEDREKVVEAWRNLGYSCWQVRSGGY